MKYVIGTRGSKLALAQAEYVQSRLAKAYAKEEFEIQVIKTKGDLILDKPLHEIGDKGIFVREIEEKLLSGEIQIGVHSMKDMPVLPAEGLLFTKAWKREDPRDVLVLREKKSLRELPEGAVIGTGSRRREIQLKKLRPDIHVVGIRGNVQTRLKKMEEEKLDGIVLAAAGLLRLGMEQKITQYLDKEEMIPAPAQGILALEIQKGNEKLLEMLDALCDADTVREAEAERGFLQEIGGGCHIPAGAVCQTKKEDYLELTVMFGNEAGTKTAYAEVCGKNPKEMARKAAVSIRQQFAGTVFLVGAGPGNPELITVKGLETIREADCILYDRLVPFELLKEAPNGCEMIYVGKESHNHTMKQEDIHRLLVQKSMEYEKVVRLKGGDAYVFGRGGEEGLYLRQNGVPFEVVPGISSCMAGLAYAGIPITHRGISSGFHVVTAHDKNDGLAEIDFQAMARSKETCVFLMGLDRVREIAKKLMQAGMREETKTAVISHATTPNQKVCVSDLAHIAEEVKAAELSSPAVIVAGDVIKLRERLNFFEELPLFGKRYLVPKIGEKPTELSKLLRKQGAAADEIQVGEIRDRKLIFEKERLSEADWLVFTSRHGVDSFFRNLKESRLDVRSLSGCKIAAIGGKTAEALQRYGIYADLKPPKYHSDALLKELKERVSKEDKVWYLKAAGVTNRLCEEMKKICSFEEIAVYENAAAEPDVKRIPSFREYDGIFFTCASSAERLLNVCGTEETEHTQIYSIGPKTTECLKAHGIEAVLEAEESTCEKLAELCLKT